MREAAFDTHSPRPQPTTTSPKKRAHRHVQGAPARPQIRKLGVLLRIGQLALLDVAGRAVRHADNVAVARLLQGQLVHLALHNDDLALPRNVIQAVQNLFSALDLLWGGRGDIG